MLDWCCIGAQKAGTSTLFRLLREHPELYVPPGKEEALFHRPVDDGEIAAYRARHFPPERVEGLRVGTVTPQYMSSPGTAARVHRACPDCQVVVLLRDPCSRAFSHYRMNVRRGIEPRPFAVAVDEELAALEAGPPESPDDETATYVYRGRYAEILAPWFELFGPDRILVALLDDLERDPLGTLHDVHRFLGVPPHTTGQEGMRSHADPPPHRLPGLRRKVAGALRQVGVLDRIPPESRERVAFRLESLMARVAPRADDRGDGVTVDRLRAFYAEDREVLMRLLGRPVPWN